MFAWLDERLGPRAECEVRPQGLPVHSSFFLGEMALFSFVVLVVTGVYLGLIYAPSNVDVPLSSVAGSRGQRRFEYLEPPQQAPLRLALGGGLLTLIGLFVVAAYAGQLGLELVQYWFVIMTAVPLTIGLLYAGARGRAALDADRPDRRAGRARGRGGRRLTAFISVPRWPWPARSSHWR